MSRNLADAVRIGDLSGVVKLLKEGADPNGASRRNTRSKRVTPLTEAIEHGHLAIVAELLRRGAKVNYKIRGVQPALHTAVYRK